MNDWERQADRLLNAEINRPDPLQALLDSMVRDLERLDVTITVETAVPTLTLQDVAAQAEESERNKPILYCPPDTEDKFTAMTQKTGLIVNVIETDLCPPGEVIMQFPPITR